MNGETGSTIRSAIDALKGSPFLLGLVLMNLIIMAAIFFAVRQEREMAFELDKITAAQTDTLIQLLAACGTK